MRLCALRCGLENFEEYLVLGDDVVIASEAVANEYIRLLRRMGVDISLPKRVISNDNFSRCEFASRLFSKGVEYSPLPLGLILEEKSLLALFFF